MIYNKPTYQIMKSEMIDGLELEGGETFTRQDAIQWFTQKYPKISKGSITTHLIRLSTNASSRHHYKPKTDGSDDIFFQIDNSHFRLYNPETDPTPLRKTSPQPSINPSTPQRFFIPLLIVLRNAGGELTSKEARADVIELLNITETELEPTLKSGVSRLENQIDWARDYLNKTGYLAPSPRGVWRLSEMGLTTDLDSIDVVQHFRDVVAETKEKRLKRQENQLDEFSKLAEPFDKIFVDYAHAKWAFLLLHHIATQLGIKGPDDERFVATLRHNSTMLRLNFCLWMIVDFTKDTVQLTLAHDVAPQDKRVSWHEDFANLVDPNRPIAIYTIPLDLFIERNDDFIEAFDKTAPLIRTQFQKWESSLHRKANRQFLVDAIFDPDQVSDLLTYGQLEDLETVATSGPDAEDKENEFLLEPYTEDDFLHETFLEHELTDDLVAMLQDKKQLILQGPPGTGKTFVAQRLAQLLTELADPSTELVETVQFHPAYSYEDFIEGIRPKSSQHNGQYMVEYPAEPGTFHKFCLRAQKRPNQNFVFIIDEINRGNIPRIFGELMLLLEYRNHTVTLPYSGKPFSIPPNVYLIGTMNTADRSIALVDFALRRRFHFVSFQADPDLFDRWLEAHPLPIPYLGALYRQLATHAIDDKQFAIGPSHFMDELLTEEKLERVWRWSIVPYLREYYFDQPAKAEEWIWDGSRIQGIREQNETM